ncbi:MAG: hypothetical protein GSR86_00700 [Desulfurococcales archaeon]|nr:hypothetical protein [Desulfurococcales archaeon]
MPIVEERYFEEHYRIIRVAGEGRVFYSIDYYKLLERPPEECSSVIEMGDVRLCYIDRGRCVITILITPNRVELVSLRLVVDEGEDPGFEGAKSECYKRAESL